MEECLLLKLFGYCCFLFSTHQFLQTLPTVLQALPSATHKLSRLSQGPDHFVPMPGMVSTVISFYTGFWRFSCLLMKLLSRVSLFLLLQNLALLCVFMPPCVPHFRKALRIFYLFFAFFKDLARICFYLLSLSLEINYVHRGNSIK